MTARSGAAVGSSTAASDAPVTNEDPPPSFAPGSGRLASLRRATHVVTPERHEDDPGDELDDAPDGAARMGYKVQEQPAGSDHQQQPTGEVDHPHPRVNSATPGAAGYGRPPGTARAPPNRIERIRQHPPTCTHRVAGTSRFAAICCRTQPVTASPG